VSPRDIPAEPDLPRATAPHGMPGQLPQGAPGLPPRGTPSAPPRPMPPLSLLVAITGLGPFTMQIIIPCLPGMAVALAVPYGTIQLALTLFLIGVATGQLVYGPLSDRFGRKPLLLGGLGMFLLGSLLAALAPNAWWLIAARVLQALGSCAGLVLGRAMIRDSYPRERSASVMGYVSTAMAVAPMIAPLLGSLLAEQFGWRATMAACLIFGLLVFPLVWWRMPETLARPVAMPGIGGLLGAYAQLLRLPLFRGYTAVTTLSTAVFFAFAAGGPVVVIAGLGHAATTYGAAMMLISVAWMSGTFTAARLVGRHGVDRMMRVGTLVTVLGGVLAIAVQALLPPSLMAFFLPMAVVALGNGMTQPNAIAAAVSVRPQLAGTASGLVGALQMGAGAVMTVVTGFTETGSGMATAVAMLAGGLGALAGLVAVSRAPRVG
jgi:DHA1 family bicyclomycin/chloramphenicol resistance-like MFS transporter